VTVRPTLVLLAALLGTPAAAQDAPMSRWAGDWVGTYRCAQGETGLTLRLRESGDGTLQGLFHFWPLAENPDAAEGCFAMRGTPTAGSGLRLAAGRWLLRPEDYVTVDLKGTLDAEGRLRGVVGGPGCSIFSLQRGTPPPALPAACAGLLALR
jgi:hypothetical protein